MKHLSILRLGAASSSLLFVVSMVMGCDSASDPSASALIDSTKADSMPHVADVDTCARAGREPDAVYLRRLNDFENYAAYDGGIDKERAIKTLIIKLNTLSLNYGMPTPRTEFGFTRVQQEALASDIAYIRTEFDIETYPVCKDTLPIGTCSTYKYTEVENVFYKMMAISLRTDSSRIYAKYTSGNGNSGQVVLLEVLDCNDTSSFIHRFSILRYFPV